MISSDTFIFNKVTDEDIKRYANNSNVFNLSEKDILCEKIELVSFTDEKLGSSEEKLDLAVFSDGKWTLLDIEDKVRDYNEIPLGYLLGDTEFSRVLVIVRRMSTFIADTKKDSVSSYIFCKVPDKYKEVSKDKALFGLLAKSRVFLDESEDNIKAQIQSNIVDRNEEICSRLFS